jgi:hypothetical protein
MTAVTPGGPLPNPNLFSHPIIFQYNESLFGKQGWAGAVDNQISLE